MAISLKHKFTLNKADGTDNTVVQPSDWNDEHQITAASGKVLGTRTDSTTVSELPIAVDANGNVTLPGNLTVTGSVVGGVFPAGTKMLFQQTNAPTGWTKDTNANLNSALRVTGGAVGTGGSWNFTDVFTNRGISGGTSANAINGWVAAHTLSWNEMPVHNHGIGRVSGTNGGGGSPTFGAFTDYVSTNAGSSWSHAHGFGNDAHSHTTYAELFLGVKYVDVIIATKD